MTLNPVADAYVSSSSPTSNYGSATALRVDGSPDVHSYLKFDVQGLPAGITKATLLLYANSTLPAGINLNAVADTGWDEKTITYNNAPAYNSTATSSSGAIKTTGWVTLDVTPLIGGNGMVSFTVTSTGSTAINLSSKEAGSNAPQLVIQY
jgi:hypothetical protein